MSPRWIFATAIAAMLVGQAASTTAADLYVNCETGNDSNDGKSADKAFKTMAAGVKAAVAGDTVHLAKTATPYREPLEFVDKSGEPGKPITLDGHDATISSAKAIVAEEWTDLGDGLYRNDKLLFPERILRRQKEHDDAMMGRYFFLWNGEMIRMGRSSKGDFPPLPAPADLKPKQWTFVESEYAFYLKVAPGKKLSDEHIEYPTFTNAVGIVGKVEHVIIKNLTGTHVINDGVGLVGYSRDLLFDHFRAIECGDDGMSAHEDNEFETRDYVAIGNSTGIIHCAPSRSINRRAYFKHNHAMDIEVVGAGRHEFYDTVIVPERVAVKVYNVAVENNPGASANPAYATGEHGITVVFNNVWIRDERATVTETDHRFMLEVFGPHTLIADQLTLSGVDLVTYGDAKVTLTNSLIGGKRKPSITIDPKTIWTASANIYDVETITASNEKFDRAGFDAFRKATGEGADSKWTDADCKPANVDQFPADPEDPRILPN